jgi:hypothetical protein
MLRHDVTNGLGTASSGVTSGGMNAATTLSTSGSEKAASSACANSSADACGSRETGPCVTRRPQLSAADALSEPSASELPTTATRSPVGIGWWSVSWATSKSWWTFSTRMTPACRSRALKACGGTFGVRVRCPGGAAY